MSERFVEEPGLCPIQQGLRCRALWQTIVFESIGDDGRVCCPNWVLELAGLDPTTIRAREARGQIEPPTPRQSKTLVAPANGRRAEITRRQAAFLEAMPPGEPVHMEHVAQHCGVTIRRARQLIMTMRQKGFDIRSCQAPNMFVREESSDV